jgi:hypothetical protein
MVEDRLPQGRALAVHALLHGARCRTRRVGELLGISLRTVGRDRQQPPVTTAPILERAQTLLAASAEGGSMPEERAAATAWLTAGATPETFGSPAGTGQTPETRYAPRRPSERPEGPMAAERPESPALVSWTRDQVDVCGRLHRRIRVGTDAIRRLLEPETAHDDLIEVVLELLVEIRGATEALETLLQDAWAEGSRHAAG